LLTTAVGTAVEILRSLRMTPEEGSTLVEESGFPSTGLRAGFRFILE
jgi:hypothetical protein